ncbi:unnamed protein product [Bubo scandiacus]
MFKVSYWKKLQNSCYSQEAVSHLQTRTPPQEHACQRVAAVIREGHLCASPSTAASPLDAQFILSCLQPEPNGLQKAESSVCSVMLNVNNSIA